MTMIRAMRSFAFIFAFMTVLPLAAAAPVQTYSGSAASTYGPIEYDPTGNVIAVGSSTSATNEYVYDPGSRIVLSAVQRAGNLHQQSYTYDAYGNLLATNSAGGLITRQVDPATNRLGSGAPLHAEYDAAGNLTAWIPPNQASTRNYHYDSMNALVRESGTGLAGTAFVYHAYTAGDERFWTETVPPGATAKNIVASYTIRDLGGQVLREYRSHPCISPCDPIRVEREYAYRAGQLLGASTPTAKHSYTLDHLGTPRLVTDQGRNLVAEHNYFPFGLEITDNAPTDGPLRFTGHERDADVLGHSAGMLDYMHARYYSAMGGRFLSVDPAVDLARVRHEPQVWNRYSYASNNPLKYVDPDGRCSVPSGLRSGLVGICIESFIAARRIGGIGFGDNRGFAANDPDATFRTSYKLLMDPANGSVLGETKDAGVSEAGLRNPFLAFQGTTSVSGGMVTDGDGTTRMSLFITGANGLSVLNTFGDIGFVANLNVSKDGAVSVDPSSSTKGFPSIEGYAYRMVDGEVVTEVLFQKKEEKPSDLKGEMDRPLVKRK